MMRKMRARGQRQWLYLRALPYPLLLLCLAGFGLRLYAIGRQPVWLDEAFSIWLAHQPLIERWAWLIQIDQHPPLYYTLLGGWQGLFGDLQGPVRLFSALCSTLTLPFFYGAARRFFDQRTALIATLLLALAPFQVRYAQEARMYALLTLTVALALYWLARLLSAQDHPHPRWGWPVFAVAQAAVMLTHNTAAVCFPVALNLALGATMVGQFLQRGGSALPALNRPGFARRWLYTQLLALICWLPWSVPFLIQAAGVDRTFWLSFPSGSALYTAFHNFHLAYQPTAPVPWLVGDLLYWGLGLVGIWALRRQGALLTLLLTLFFFPIAATLLVSLRRPIFAEHTLIWVTLPYYLLVAGGLVHASRRLAATGRRWLAQGGMGLLLGTLVGLNSLALANYYQTFTKEAWPAAAAYVAANMSPDDLLLFNATWVQLPFDYYFRHYDLPVTRHGVPVDLFDRGVLEPAMTPADLPRLQHLLTDHDRVWLIYSHDWYTDPQGLIPRELGQRLRLVEQVSFTGLQVLRFER